MSSATPAAETVASYMSATDVPPVQSRSELFQSENVDDFSPVTGREAHWKRSPVARLAPLLDGGLEGSAYPVDVSDSPHASVRFESVDSVTRGHTGLPEERLSANAWGQVKEVLVIELSVAPSSSSSTSSWNASYPGIGRTVAPQNLKEHLRNTTTT